MDRVAGFGLQPSEIMKFLETFMFLDSVEEIRNSVSLDRILDQQ